MIGSKVSKVPVLMYHALEDPSHPAGSKDIGEQVYVLQVEQFRQHMEYLQKAGFVTFFLEELIGMSQWPRNAIVLTFDDGHQSNVSLALPILGYFGFKAHFFITTGWIDTPYYLTSRQIQTLCSKGMVIGSHGVTHRYFNEMNADAAHEELQMSRDALQAIVSKPVTLFSAPGGRITHDTVGLGISLGYSVCCTSRAAMLHQGGDVRSIPRFAIRSNTSFEEFTKIVHGNLLYLFQRSVKSALLYLGKAKFQIIAP